MKIIDEYGKERDADILGVTTHEIEDNGEMIMKDFLQIKINGKNLNWETYIPLKIFRENNPEIEI